MSFEDVFNVHTEGLSAISTGVCSNCRECYDSAGDIGPEDFVAECESGDIDLDDEFSKSSCDTCGTCVAGSRHVAHAICGDELIHMMVCVDCLFFINYGETPEGSDG